MWDACGHPVGVSVRVCVGAVLYVCGRSIGCLLAFVRFMPDSVDVDSA